MSQEQAGDSTIADRPMLGIGLMLCFCVLAPIGDSIAKVLGDTIPLWQLLTARFVIQALLLIPMVGLVWQVARDVRLLVVARTLLHISGIAALFVSLRYMPLADAVAIAFVMPLILLLLGRGLAHEQVGARRWIVCVVGFVGTLMVIQPSFVQVGWAAFLPLGVAVSFAFFMLATRAIAKRMDPLSLQSVSGLLGSAILLLIGLISLFVPIPGVGWVSPTGGEWTLLLTIGVIGTVAHLLMTWSLRYAPSSTLAPMQYLEIPVATLVGWLVFADLPNGLAALGILVTIGAGLYVVISER